jgi:hypothetical protein
VCDNDPKTPALFPNRLDINFCAAGEKARCLDGIIPLQVLVDLLPDIFGVREGLRDNDDDVPPGV